MIRASLLAVVSAAAWTALAPLAMAQTPAAEVATPADTYQELFHQVQTRRLFPDGKTFVDATPRRDPAAILKDYRVRARFTDAELKRFVRANFVVPEARAAPAPSAERTTLKAHVAQLWPHLTREPVKPVAGGSALAMAKPFVVPGGRFREIYYWDSYFTMLGLKLDGRSDLVESMIDDFGGLIDAHGHIPNGARTYYLSRSQPPFFYAMVGLSEASDPAVVKARVDLMRREHAFWMDGEKSVAPGKAWRRVVALPGGAVLNRYYDDRVTPRDESYREDLETAREASLATGRPPSEVFRDLRAGAESGWDFSSRWMADGQHLKTIRTTAIVPVDLNALMYGLEGAISAGCARIADTACVAEFDGRAKARKAAMDSVLWDASRGVYLDYLWTGGERIDALSAATLYPLFVGAASPEQAKAVATATRAQLLASGGLRTTTRRTGQQWDTPNGWAPLQWVAVAGLRRYGETGLASDVSDRWLATVEREYRASGKMLEKYDVEEAKAGGGGEYPLQDGFGWTNGVTRALQESAGN
ncbi:trehalase [Caulobacter flavus]|uniref:Trehalase n=1 Tax=Caulobacter flavus TaxID=1679497 RepID=A0A2N5CQV5_9CAUL|nr:alpha,alpha-trehalase TreF [Caulobacter flavus]AYV48810.1 trehalase [Caulobacter flavus]PLR10342.1 trehalase [Caulobacter flavus]